MKLKTFLYITLLYVSASAFSFPSETLNPKQNIAFEDLTIDEEIGQVIMIAVDLQRIDSYKKLIEKGIIGGVLLQWGDYSLEETKQLVNKLQKWSKVPLLVAADYEGGITLNPSSLGLVNLPTNMMLGAANDEKDTAALFYLAGMELHRAGVNVNFAPVLDVNTNMQNPVIGVRSFASEEEIVSKLGAAVINGLQTANIMAVAKHFPGHGDISVDTHKTIATTTMSVNKLESIHLKPFESAINVGVMGIMTAHIIYTELDSENIATFSKKILDGLLRKKLGFNGIIVSDSLDMKSVTNTTSIPQASINAINAGVDLIIARSVNPYTVHAAIKQELSNSMKPSRLADASRKIFDIKKNLGLFNGSNNKISASDKAYQNIASTIAKKAITVIRDNQKIIPFNTTSQEKTKKVCTVFFAPPRFAQELININKPFIKEGWLVTQYNGELIPKSKDIEYASECIKNSDLAIIGTFQWANNPYFSQIRGVSKLLQIDKPIILVSLMSPFDIRFYLRAKTIIATYGITPYSIEAIAEVILGKLKPKGKLPVKLLPFERLTQEVTE